MPTAVLVPSSARYTDLYMHISIHLFIHLSINRNIEMDTINCSCGRLSFFGGIPRINLEKAAGCRNGEGEEYITRWIKG